MSDGPLIETRALTKTFRAFARREGVLGAVRDVFQRDYRDVRAVEAVDLAIEEGEVVGYIGPNGAGKSTTIKMLTGILVPTSGMVRVAGFVPWREREAYTRHIGVVFGQRTSLWWDVAVVESLRLLQKVYGVSERDFRDRVDRFDAVLELKSYLHTPARKLSLGQRMRAELAAALIHAPRVLFLDEPTIGLDVAVKARIREFLREINRDLRTTILLTTHDLDDIEALCRRVVVIDRGLKIYDGSLTGLTTKLGDRRQVRLTAAGATLDAVREATGGLDVAWSEAEPGVFCGAFRPDAVSVADLLQRALGAARVTDVAIEEIDVEQVVRTLYEGARGGPPSSLHGDLAAAP
ncbi:MAG: ATP-binding cassette domain-containing protein [Actinomycetota bacterium]|nr:ATP-binding cassette domain-containing protein [Actinomycetota bacterium]